MACSETEWVERKPKRTGDEFWAKIYTKIVQILAFSAFRPAWRPHVITQWDYAWCLALALTHYTRCVRFADFTWFVRKSKRTARFWHQNFDGFRKKLFLEKNRECVSACDQATLFQASKSIECSVSRPGLDIANNGNLWFLVIEAVAVTHCKIRHPKKIEVDLEFQNQKYFGSQSILARAMQLARPRHTSRWLAMALAHITAAFQPLLWPGCGESRNGLQILDDFCT